MTRRMPCEESVWDAAAELGGEGGVEEEEEEEEGLGPLELTDKHMVCDILQHTTTCCNTLQHTATHSNTLQRTATCCNMLQHAATHCNTLQYTRRKKRVWDRWG